MKFLCILFCFLTVFLLIWDRLTYKYLNRWKLIFVCGPKGTGKSTDLVKRRVKAIRKGQKVYCTEPVINIRGKIFILSGIPDHADLINQYKGILVKFIFTYV